MCVCVVLGVCCESVVCGKELCVFMWRGHGVCVDDGECTAAWCVQVKRMIRGIGNVLCST